MDNPKLVNLDCPREIVKQLINREPEIARTTDGKFIVLFMRFGFPPPPKGETEQEALEKFIKFYKENPNGIDGNQNIERNDQQD